MLGAMIRALWSTNLLCFLLNDFLIAMVDDSVCEFHLLRWLCRVSFKDRLSKGIESLTAGSHRTRTSLMLASRGVAAWEGI